MTEMEIVYRGILFLAGGWFLFSGGAKLLFSRVFVMHIEQMNLLPRKMNGLLALLLIELECAFGAALLLSVYPETVIPLAFGLILILTLVTFWGMKRNHLADCGCYGMVMKVAPQKSIVINILFLGLLWIAWRMQEIYRDAAFWKIGIVITTVAVCNILAKRSLNSPLVDITPLKPNKKWKQGWGVVSDDLNKRWLLLFLNEQCTVCDKWLKNLNIDLSRDRNLQICCIYPDTVGFEKLKRFGLPDEVVLVTIRQGIFHRLVYLSPTAVLIKDGIIQQKWVNRFPTEMF